MQGSISSRPMKMRDCAAVLALWRRTKGVEVAEGDDRAGLVAHLKRNARLSRVATVRNQIVGAILCGHDGRRGLLYHLAVDESHRNRGIGRRLVKESLDGLKRAGLTRVILLVGKTNAGGRRFWRLLGFEPISGAIPLGKDLG